MTNETTPYISRNPGDLITAEDWNDVQVKIQEDMQNQIASAKEQIKETGVDRADNADKFDNKTPEEWTSELDDRYAPKVHDHEEIAAYRRYFLELETTILVETTGSARGAEIRILQPAVITHTMGRHPIVQVYELLKLDISSAQISGRGGPPAKEYKFCFCSPPHHIDPEALGFKTKSWDEFHWGDPIDDVIEDLARGLDEEQQEAFKAQFQDKYTLNVWLSNLERALFEPGPAQYHFDMGDVYRTQWIQARASKTVKELRDDLGEWPPHFVYRPRLINAGDWTGSPARPSVDILHLNLNQVEIAPQTDDEMHLMVILRS